MSALVDVWLVLVEVAALVYIMLLFLCFLVVTLSRFLSSTGHCPCHLCNDTTIRCMGDKYLWRENICSFEHVLVNTQDVVNTARPHAVAAGAQASQEKSGDHWVSVVVIREEKAT